MGKNPAFQFYPSDWINDIPLQSASCLSRGIWINCLCRMWWNGDRGNLTGNKDLLSRLLNCNMLDFDAFLEEAKMYKFCEVSHDANGNLTLTNRRMNREEKKRKNDALRQKKSYHKKKPHSKPHENLTSPSSSSTSSTSNKGTLSRGDYKGILREYEDLTICQKCGKKKGERGFCEQCE